MRILELFSGIGGWRYAAAGCGDVVAAYDISPTACETYALNHGDRPHARELASIKPDALRAHGADTWVMSPPCQPFCRMGNQHGLEDRRSRAYLRLLEILEQAPPQNVVLENVSGFRGSDAHARLISILDRHGLAHRDFDLCPTQFGIPNQRPRFFLVASRDGLRSLPLESTALKALGDYLDASEDASLYLDEETLAKHGPGLDFVEAEDRRSTCFIGGYGRRYVGSGSFLRTRKGVRRFSPFEIARIMGIPEGFHFPESIPMDQRYKLLGNGLNITVAAWVIRHLAGAGSLS